MRFTKIRAKLALGTLCLAGGVFCVIFAFREIGFRNLTFEKTITFEGSSSGRVDFSVPVSTDYDLQLRFRREGAVDLYDPLIRTRGSATLTDNSGRVCTIVITGGRLSFMPKYVALWVGTYPLKRNSGYNFKLHFSDDPRSRGLLQPTLGIVLSQDKLGIEVELLMFALILFGTGVVWIRRSGQGTG